jgi:hypothetical protein
LASLNLFKFNLKITDTDDTKGVLVTIVNYPTHWSTSTIKPTAAKCGKIKFLEKSGPELKVIFEERSEAFQFFDKLRAETFKGQLLIPLYPADKI